MTAPPPLTPSPKRDEDPRPPALTAPSKILVIQLYRIGDALLTLPTVKELKKKFPQAAVDFLAENPAAEILQGNPSIHRLIVYDKKRAWHFMREIRAQKYDWVIDFLGTPRTAVLTALSGAKVRAGLSRVFHRWAYNYPLTDPQGSFYVAEEKIRLLQPLGIEFHGDVRAEIKIPETSKAFARDFFSQNQIRSPKIILSPVSRRHFNRWPLEKYASLADRLIMELKASILIPWGPGEKEEATQVMSLMKEKPLLAPSTRNLMDLAAFMEGANLFIGNDNGVKHIAAALKVPTFTIYGPHSPVSWTFPDPARHRFIQKSCPCREEAKNEHLCREVSCLNSISSDEVFKHVKDFLTNLIQ